MAAIAQEAQLSFRELYEEHAAFAWRVVRRLGISASDADDVIQEVFVVVHRRLPDFEYRSSLSTWIYGIAFRVASAYRRKAHHRHEVMTESPDSVSEMETQTVLIDRQRAIDSLDEILSDLDENKRAVFVFYEIEGISMEDISEIVKCPVQTCYSRLRSARKQVQVAIARRQRKEENI